MGHIFFQGFQTQSFRTALLVAGSLLFLQSSFAATRFTVLDELVAPAPVLPGTTDPASLDPDADGVPSKDDNCPFLPNPKRVDGTQAEVCSIGATAPMERQVYLKSRVFTPQQGLDPRLETLPSAETVHVLLHLSPTLHGALLSKSLRSTLESFGVEILDYVPDDSYYVSLQPDPSVLQSILLVDGVVGISARATVDRVAPAIRLRGALERADDGSFEFMVEFFHDLAKPAIEALLSKLGLNYKHQYDTTYSVGFASWDELALLAAEDGVKWIDEMDGAPVDYTLNAQAAIGGTMVSEHFGYRGNGLTVAMFEKGPLRLDPIHPDMDGRITIGNIPFFAYEETQHAWNVASIMIADETSFPDNLGFLPEADLVSYAADGVQTRKRRYFGIPKEARQDYDALVFNNSWGDYRCGRIGEYTGHAKHRDRAIFDHGIIMVDGAGNGRSSVGYPEDGCSPDYYSLGFVNAKNSIMVGNWSLTTNSLSSGSSKGPAADGRLKPDVVVPGEDIDTLDFWITDVEDISGTPIGGLEDLDLIGESSPTIFSGTSAAAPVTSGVVGWIGEAFLEQGYTVQSIMPAAVKAILIHTASDVGLPGPDFDHGYGLIQPAPAVRIAQEWSQWGRQHTFSEESTSHEFEFDIASDLFTYKVTLAWDDVEGEDTANKSLKNDLDLVVFSPSGQAYRPFDLGFPNGSGSTPAEPCTSDDCDSTNNVEQVVISNTDGTPLEHGLWRATVTARRLVSDEQSMALVLTPPCPVVITQDTTLTGPISCTPSAMQPSAVEIPVAGVTLDCNEESITGSNSDANSLRDFVGVRVLANDVNVQHCDISRFDIGIKVGDADREVNGGNFNFNTLSTIFRRGIDVWGDENTVSSNVIDGMQDGARAGVRIQGNRNLTSHNELYNGTDDESPVGIYLTGGGSINVLNTNLIDGNWSPAIHVHGEDENTAMDLSVVTLNVIREVPGDGIVLSGNITNSQVDINVIEWYGSTSSAVLVEEANNLKPDQNTVALNFAYGSQTPLQTGIRLNQAEFTNVNANIVADMGIGIFDIGSESSLINNNVMLSLDTAQPYRSLTGVWRQGGAVSHINGNDIQDSLTGISVIGTSKQLFMRSNVINADNLGISVSNSVGDDISGNNVTARLLGISYIGGSGATINGNEVSGYTGTGIYVGNADNLSLTDNTVTELTGVAAGTSPSVGLHYSSGTTANITNNTIISTTWGIGIKLGNEPLTCNDIAVDDTTVEPNKMIGVGTQLSTGCDVGS
ncbi:MAG: S8 family serine peptidase [Candidatus Thiodiazotropha sp.]